jgi:hypothetical protein
MTRLFLSAVTMSLVTFMTASAALVYDNGPLNITNGIGGRNMTSFRDADDFVLGASASISSIRFWLTNGELPAFGGTVTYAVYQDSAGALGTMIASDTVNPAVSIVTLGVFTLVPQLDVTLTSPLTLGSGTYWLELHEGATLTTNDSSLVFWVRRNGVTSGNAKQDAVPSLPTTSTVDEMGFQLFDSAGSPVPEPSTGMLGMLALGGFALIRGLRH